MLGATAQSGHVMTLANSIIGVAILSMPFCFQKCGILLSIVLLVVINICTRVCCHYLIKSSILCRRRSMEIMALYVFGPSGKLMVELCTIGYLMGTCVAYFVVVGDLGPQIVSKMLDIARTDTLRVWIMLLVTGGCVVPLGLLKNVDSLSTVCTASIGFYFCLVVKVMAEAKDQVYAGEWLDNVYWWRWSGVLQCLPIFSLSLSCQIVIFEVYETVTNASLSRMNDIVKSAISMCTCVYVAVGFFGYVAFAKQEFSGNILLNLEPSMTSDVIQMGFVMSVACSFPLVIFPCRASLYSLLYQRDHSEVAHYIPEHRFRFVTLAIILPSMIIGILTPSIELIIGLVGSTIGVAICIMFPASCFIKLGKKESSEMLLAKCLLVFGFFLMVLGTYANLAAFEDRTSGLQSVEHDHDRRVPEQLIPILPTEEIAANPERLQFERPEIPVEEVKIIPLEVNTPKIEQEPPRPEPAIKIIPLAKDEADELIAKSRRQPAPEQRPDLNVDAIANEEREIAVEAKANVDQEIKGEIKKTKELVEEIKEVLAKHNEKTQQIVMEKFEAIVDKVEHIEKAQEAAVANSLATAAELKIEKRQANISLAELPRPEMPAETRSNDTKDAIVQMIQQKVKERPGTPTASSSLSALSSSSAPKSSSAASPSSSASLASSTSSPPPPTQKKLVDKVQEIPLATANESLPIPAEHVGGVRDILSFRGAT